NIAAANLQRARTIDLERPDLRYLSLELLLGEERLDRLLAQLHPQHPEALTGEPGQVQTLATQWHQHRRNLLELQPRSVAAQPGVNMVEMKTDVVAGPTALPEVCVHAGCCFGVVVPTSQILEITSWSQSNPYPRHNVAQGWSSTVPSARKKRCLHIHPGIAHLRQLVTQGSCTDAQAVGGLLATAAFGPQGIEDQLEFAPTQVLAQRSGRLDGRS